MIPQVRNLLQVIGSGTYDRQTIGELLAVVDDRRRWAEAHELFSRIREKTLRAIAEDDRSLQAQYAFEEICAKSIYNESNADDPFDLDSPFWVLPLALEAARRLGIDQDRVLSAVTA